MTLRIVSPVVALVTCFVGACGGAVSPSPTLVGPETSPTTPTPAPSGNSAATPTAPAVVPAAVDCNRAGAIATFDGTITDIALDATHVWALLARDGTWALDKAPKCGGQVEHIGDAPQGTQAAGPPVPTRLALTSNQGAIVEWWDEGPTVSLTGFGAASRINVTTLYGPDVAPMALAIGTTAAYTAIGDQLRHTLLVEGSFGQPTWDPLVPLNKPWADHVHDLWFDAGVVYATTSGRAVSFDVTSKKIVRSMVLLMDEGPRFVRTFNSWVYVVGDDIARLPPDLQTFELFHMNEPGPVIDVAIQAKGIFFTKTRSGGGEEVYKVGLVPGKPEALPVIPGPGGQLAVDANALYVGRGSTVERVSID